MIYFDQAASSFPKPPEVGQAVSEAILRYGANPGRSGHKLARQANSIIETTRRKLNKMFHSHSPDRVVFSNNATSALNQAIEGLTLKRGDHVLATVFEHNSVRRPLERLKREKGVTVDYLQADGQASPGKWADVVKRHLTDRTKLVIVTHGSNVTGEIIPVKEIGDLVADHPALYCVDASQTAGVLEIDMKEMGIDLLAFPGHKGLLGPQGTGVLMVANNVSLRPVHVGGTGSASELPAQPDIWPAGWESGTLNTPGIAGLLKGLEAVEKYGLDYIHSHEKELASYCIKELEAIEGVKIVGPGAEEERLGVVSFYIKGVDSNEAAIILDEHYNIAVRAGLHCAPLTHKIYKTADSGLIRASFGIYNTFEEVDTFTDAIKEIKEGLLE
ncbi:aminotransferase class V-fold PLP-dependent enzyme [Salipaludibacillus sp. CUR1]|uniref:aminotransferase class V-fold PLP-dependent enzyme n=1 Tax=Salipaludibacillus sp. CUR1 TaxID=2820003 RepID=UPI001E341031|nr:aminotransferase class V-fold PLP-dependent enzyme [Salipaludibacillus sp. CUR1]MCE7790984.1 aminotransferase class V-fold PLP-dependent enzyme [Salipaludibacillus sp. CUR1]